MLLDSSAIRDFNVVLYFSIINVWFPQQKNFIFAKIMYCNVLQKYL